MGNNTTIAETNITPIPEQNNSNWSQFIFILELIVPEAFFRAVAGHHLNLSSLLLPLYQKKIIQIGPRWFWFSNLIVSFKYHACFLDFSQATVSTCVRSSVICIKCCLARFVLWLRRRSNAEQSYGVPPLDKRAHKSSPRASYLFCQRLSSKAASITTARTLKHSVRVRKRVFLQERCRSVFFAGELQERIRTCCGVK